MKKLRSGRGEVMQGFCWCRCLPFVCVLFLAIPCVAMDEDRSDDTPPIIETRAQARDALLGIDEAKFVESVGLSYSRAKVRLDAYLVLEDRERVAASLEALEVLSLCRGELLESSFYWILRKIEGAPMCSDSGALGVAEDLGIAMFGIPTSENKRFFLEVWTKLARSYDKVGQSDSEFRCLARIEQYASKFLPNELFQYYIQRSELSQKSVQYAEAFQFAERALGAALAPVETVDALERLSTCLSCLGELSRAEVELQRAFEIAESNGLIGRANRVRVKLGQILIGTLRVEEGIELCEVARGEALEQDELSLAVSAACHLATGLVAEARFAQASAVLNHALELAQAVGRDLDIGRVLDGLGYYHSRTAEYSIAIELFLEAGKKYHAADFAFGAAVCLVRAAEAACVNDDAGLAVDLLSRSEVNSSICVDPAILPMVHRVLISLYAGQNCFSRVVALCRSVIEARERVGQERRNVDTSFILAYSLGQIGQYDDARGVLEELRADPDLEASNVGRFYLEYYSADLALKSGRSTEVGGFVSAALKLSANAPLAKTFWARLFGVSALRDLGRFVEARKAFSELQTDFIDHQGELSEAYDLLLGLYSMELDLLGGAGLISRVRGLVTRLQRIGVGKASLRYEALFLLARCYSRIGEDELALDLLLALREEVRGRGCYFDEDLVLAELGRVCDYIGRTRDALIYLEQSAQVRVNRLPEERGARLEGLFREVAQRVILLGGEDNARRALSYLAIGATSGFSRNDSPWWVRETTSEEVGRSSFVAAVDAIASVGFGGVDRSDQLELCGEEMKFDFSSWHREFCKVVDEGIASDEVIYVLSRAEEEVLRFLLSRESCKVLPALEASSLVRVGRRAVSLIQSGASIEAAERARRDWRQLVLEGVDEDALYGKSLSVVADDSLGFALIPLFPTDGSETHLTELRMLTGLAELVFVDGDEVPPRRMVSVLAIGNDFDRPSKTTDPPVPKSPLPNARDEVTRVASFFEEAVTLFGAQATEERVKELAPKSRVLHFATHGWSNRGGTLGSSGLALADPPEGSEEDGILTLEEVLDLDLRETDLVVLSACESASGRIVEHGAVQSLERAFLSAGAKAVVGSLWNVDDQVCRDLMEDFYDALASGKSAGESLAVAQREQRKRTPHPVHWAPWTLTLSPN